MKYGVVVACCALASSLLILVRFVAGLIIVRVAAGCLLVEMWCEFQWSHRLRLRRSFKFLCAGFHLDNAEYVYGLEMDYTGQLHLDSDAKQCYIYSELFDSMYFE